MLKELQSGHLAKKNELGRTHHIYVSVMPRIGLFVAKNINSYAVSTALHSDLITNKKTTTSECCMKKKQIGKRKKRIQLEICMNSALMKVLICHFCIDISVTTLCWSIDSSNR